MNCLLETKKSVKTFFVMWMCRSGQTGWLIFGNTKVSPSLGHSGVEYHTRIEDTHWLSAYAGSNPVIHT